MNVFLIIGMLVVMFFVGHRALGGMHGGSSGHHSGATATVCPVSGRSLAKGDGYAVEVRGRSYRVCSEACRDKLTESPDRYLDEAGDPRKVSESESGGHNH